MNENDQKYCFESEGYLIVEQLLSEDEIRSCQNEIQTLHQKAKGYFEAGDQRAGCFQLEPYMNSEKTDESQPNDYPVLRKVERTGHLSTVFFNLARHPKLVQTVRNLIGRDVLLFRSTLMFKPAFHGSAHGLHQDSAYWPMNPPSLITVSIALNDATPENGCLQVIPKSHRWGLQDWGRISRRHDEPLTDRADIDLSNQIHVPLKAGSALFFHSLMVHGSSANQSPHSRNTALYAYFPPSVRMNSSGQRTFEVISGFSGKSEVTLTATAE